VPVTATQSTAPDQPKISGYCKEHAACAEGYLCLDSECEKEQYVVTAGNVMFHFTEAIYGLGVVYNTVAPIAFAFGLDSVQMDDGASALAPQSGIYVVFGTLNQIGKIRQARFLRRLGAEPESGLITVGWALHVLSMVTTGVNVVGFVAESRGLAISTSFVNAAVLVSSYAVNTAGYVRQRGRLRRAVSAVDTRRGASPAVEVQPYVSLRSGGGGGGLALRF